MGTKPGKTRIEEAMLSLLREKPLSSISVSELCAAAPASRSTFYSNFANVDELYRSLARGLLLQTAALRTQLKHGGSSSEAQPSRPLCAIIRDPGKYKGLIEDERFLQTVLDICQSDLSEVALGLYRDACDDPQAARTLFLFQMTGCISAAKSFGADEDWEAARENLDAFIRGGFAAIRNR